MRARHVAVALALTFVVSGIVPSAGAIDPPSGAPHAGVLVESAAFALAGFQSIDPANRLEWKVFAYHGSELHPLLTADEMRLLVLRRVRPTLSDPVPLWEFVTDTTLPASHLTWYKDQWGFFHMDLDAYVEGVGELSLYYRGNPPGLGGVGCPPILLVDRGPDFEGEAWVSAIGRAKGTIGGDEYVGPGGCNHAWGWGMSGYFLHPA